MMPDLKLDDLNLDDLDLCFGEPERKIPQK